METILKAGEGDAKCPGDNIPQLDTQGKTIPVPYNRSTIQVIPLTITNDIQSFDENWRMDLPEYFTKCGACTDMISIGGLYVCDYSKFLSVFQYTVRNPSVISWDQSEQNVFSLYVYYFCTIAWPEFIKDNPNTLHPKHHPFCPNPCSVRLNPCSKVPNAIPAIKTPQILSSISASNCILVNNGLFEGEYECLCRQGYVWNKHAKTCEAPDLCARNAEERKKNPLVQPICSEKGTLRCVSFPPPPSEHEKDDDFYLTGAHIAARYACVCRNGFMGQRCDRLRDACIESGRPGTVSGEQACRTYLGNKCTPHNGTDYYFCKCAENWVHNPAYPFPNCYKRRTICDRIICRNRGTCVGSADQRAFLCVCEYGWHGRLCELPDVRHWLPWGSWTLCSAPLCGGRGWQSRSRECRVPVNNITGLGQCDGNSVEYRPCRSGCPDPVRSYLPMIKLIVFFACCLLILQFAVGVVYVLLQMEYM